MSATPYADYSNSICWKKDIQPMLDKGLFDEADLHFQSHIERNPNNAISLCLYGYFLHFQREYKKSEKLFQKCLSLEPSSVICLNYYTDLLSAQKRWKDARDIAEQAFDLDDKRSWTIGSYCNVLRHLKKKEKVRQITQHALGIPSLTDPDTFMTLADCCWDLKMHSLTKQIFEIALQRNPSDFDLRDAFSELCIETKDLEQAALHLKILSDAHPENWSVITDYGYVLREIGKVNEAQKHYENALKINDAYPGAHNNLGFLLLHDVGDFEKAHYHFMMALKYDPDFKNPYRHLGDLYRIENDKQNFETSKMFYKKALEMRKDYKEAINGLKVLYLIQEKFVKSEKEKKEINTLDIDDEKLKVYEQYLPLFG